MSTKSSPSQEERFDSAGLPTFHLLRVVLRQRISKASPLIYFLIFNDCCCMPQALAMRPSLRARMTAASRANAANNLKFSPGHVQCSADPQEIAVASDSSLEDRDRKSNATPAAAAEPGWASGMQTAARDTWLLLGQEHTGEQGPGPGSGRGGAAEYDPERLLAARARTAEIAGQLEAIIHVHHRGGNCIPGTLCRVGWVQPR